MGSFPGSKKVSREARPPHNGKVSSSIGSSLGKGNEANHSFSRIRSGRRAMGRTVSSPACTRVLYARINTEPSIWRALVRMR